MSDNRNAAAETKPDGGSCYQTGATVYRSANVIAGTHALPARVSDAGGSARSGSASITEANTPLQNWPLAHVGLDAGNLVDLDADGLKNLLEYADGTDPKMPGYTTITHD